MNSRSGRPRRMFKDADHRRWDNDPTVKRPWAGLWKVIALISVILAILASYAFMAGKGVYNIFAPRGRFVQTATATLMKMERETQLVTTSAFVQAVVRYRDEQWYGNAEVVRIVPATIHYAVNLAEIDRNKIEYDSQSKTLWVPLPDVKILSIDPDMKNAETIRNLDLLRTEKGTGNALEDKTEKMARAILEERGMSSEIIRIAKDQAVLSVRRLLESALDAAGTGVRVNPYFESEGKTPSSEKK